MADDVEKPEYEMPAWEVAKKAADAQEARDTMRYTLAHLERVEGKVVATPGALCDRRYLLPGQSLDGACR